MRVALVVLAVPLLVHAAGQNVVRGQDRDLARMRIRQDTDEQGGKTDGGNNNGGGVNTATGGGGGGAGGGDGTATNTQPTSATQPAETTTTANPESSPSPLPTSTTERAETTADTKPTTPTQQSVPNTSAAPSRTPKQVTSTNAEGSVILITESVFITASGTSSAAPSSTSEPESPGMGTKSIIGLSVAGGLFLLGLIGFIWWKLTRKRFAGFEDDGGAIKWPDLNDNNASALQPIPARPTTTGDGTDSRTWSPTHSQNPSLSNVHVPYHDNYSMSSNVDLTRPPLDPNDPQAYAGAVPPNQQQYYDDPQYGGAGGYSTGRPPSGFYDPYRGPVPGSLDGHSMDGGATGRKSPGPNTVMYGDQRTASPGPYGRAPSPGPNVAYGGRTSPGPNMAYGGRTSPGPNMAYGGRTSPGPNVAYGGRTSPGPNVAYGGRTSPGPNVAYGRSASPGPNAAYGQRAASPGPNNM